MSQSEVQETLERIPFEHALAGAIVVTAVLAVTPAIWTIVQRIYGGRNIFFARWGFLHLLQVILFGLGFSILISFALDSYLPEDEPLGIGMLLASQCLIFGPPCLFVMFLAQRLDPDGIRCLGLRWNRTPRAMAGGLLAYFAFLPGFYGLMVVWPYLLDRFGGAYEDQAFSSLFEMASGGELWFGVAMAVLVLPFFEELLFRGFLQPLLVQNFRDRGGVAMTAILFAAMHGESAFVPILGLALLLGAVMLRTQRLLAVWALHALHNGIQVAILLSTMPVESDSGAGALILESLR
ncbi:MAG: membrane protease YdiL (CAAX protease family) [Planctomycetota bacterium]|jgi:membrane protease YdiL (CAAX protease family)